MVTHTVVLPIPPSVNHAYGQARSGARFLTAEAKSWKDGAVFELRRIPMKPYGPTQKVVVNMIVTWPNNRKRDCDNLWKLVQDSIQAAGIVQDDRYLLCRVIDWTVKKNDGSITLVIHAKEENK